MRSGGVMGHPLLKAARLRTEKPIVVVDATAGLGRDAFILALGGVEVILIERSRVVFKLLAAALEEARNFSDELAGVVERMTLLNGDSRELLSELAPDIVFIDPMHPIEGRRALSRKDIRALRTIVGDDPDSLQLVEVALQVARQRVVLKWPTRADRIPSLPPPTYQIPGKTMTYDVYQISQNTRPNGRDEAR